VICTHNGLGISVNQEKVHEQLFNNPDTYSKTIITTMTQEDRKRLFVFFKAAEGPGEKSIPLDSCFVDGQVIGYAKELDYFKEMLELFAAMCCSRNYVCTETIRNWFPITAVQENMWNMHISLSLRAVFCKLMLTIYIDAYPRERLKKPEMCRIFQRQDEFTSRRREIDQRLGLTTETTAEIRKIASSFSSAIRKAGAVRGSLGGSIGAIVTTAIPEAKTIVEDELVFNSDNSTMLELKEAILEYFNGMGEVPEFTEFSYNLVKMAYQMALFGLFSIECTDFGTRKVILSPKHKSYVRTNMDFARLLRALQCILTKSSVESLSLRTFSSRHLSGLQSKAKRKAFTYKSLIAQVMKDPYSLADPIVRAAVNLKNYVESVLQKPGKEEEEGSYELDMKIEVCKVFDYAVDCRLDYLMSNVVEWFVHSQEEEVTKKTFKTLFPPILPIKYTEGTDMEHQKHQIKKMLFDSSQKGTFRKMLIMEVPDLDELLDAKGRIVADLVRVFIQSKQYQLQTLVISLLIRLYSQRRELLGRLAELHVVTQEDDIEIFKSTKQNIVIFKQFSEQSEIWLKFWRQTDKLMRQREEEKLHKVMAIMEYLDAMLTPEDESMKRRMRDRQDMLYFLDVHLLLISLIRDGMHSLAEVVDLAVARDVVAAREQIVALFTLCHGVLRKMVERNARNQGSIHQYLHIFTSHLSIEVGQIPLICAIYHNNKELCTNVKLETLQQFIKLIIQHGRQPRFLHLFQQVQVAKGQPIPDNQRTVLSLFLSSDETRKYLLYLGNEAEHEFSFVPAPPHDQALAPYEDQPFLYHAKLFEVLMLCGYGTQRVYLNEAKCQKAIPLNTVFDLLERAEDATIADYQSWRALLIPLLDFFFNIYLETEKLNEELAGNVKFLRYVQLQEEQLYSLSTLPSDYTAYFSIFIKVISHYAKNYLRVSNESIAAEQADYVALRDFAVAFSRNLRKFHGWVVAKEVRTAAQEVLKFFNLSGDLESLLRVNAEELPVDQAITTDIDEFYSPNKMKWEAFRGNLLSSQKAKKQCKKETEALIKALINCKKLDETLHFSHLLKALIDYLRGSATQHAPTSTILKLIKMLSYLIKSDKEHLKERQEELNSYGATRVILGLLSEKELDPKVYKALIKLSVDYLNEGNETVQNEFHMYFVNTPSSKNFIERLHTVLSHHSELLASDSIQYDWKDLSSIDHLCTSLRLLQLFCENHNSNLQNYLRQQTNSRTSIDLVTATVKLLAALMKRMLFRTFLVMSQCFDTLTEAIQGPCVANQNAIIDGPFLEIATSLMSYDESAPTPLKYLSLVTEGNAFPEAESEKKYLTGWMIAHLKYKCLITVHSLMEGRTDSSIITRIIRAINLEILKENLVGIYVGYEREFTSATQDLSLFGRAEKSRKYDFTRSDNEQDLHPGRYEVVLENGFFIYHLMRKFQDTDDPENKQLINEELPKLSTHSLQKDMMAFRVIGDLSKLGLGIVKKSVQSISQVSKKLIHSEKSTFRIELSESEKKEKLSKAYTMLQENTGSIEIIFNNSISRVYFPLPPYAHCLTADIIEDFHSKVDRSSDKNKLQCLVNKAPEVIEVMKHEYRLQRVINASWIVGMIARNVSLWKDLSFWLTLLLNFLILASFSTYSTERTKEYSLFYYESRQSGAGLSFKGTQELFISLGVAQIVITSVIVLFFLIKVGPLLLGRGWRKVAVPVPRPGWVRRVWLYGRKLYYAVSLLLGEIDVLFYVLYLLFAVFGTFASPLFFAFHLLDILYRYPSLQNVIKSVTIPKKALLVTSLFSLILVYYFSIIGYAYFYDSYHKGDCDDLITCAIVTFDHSFKVNGGIGGALVDWPYGDVELSRLLFDNLYNIIIIVIMINIFQGIIIDTFAVLREENTRNSLDRSTKCFICGLERDAVERATGRSFDYHTYYEHNEWKYVQFIGYLEDKEETELTGVESYVKEKLAKKEIAWFPQQEGLSIKREGESEEVAFFAESKEIGDAVKEAAYQTQQLKKQLGLGEV